MVKIKGPIVHRVCVSYFFIIIFFFTIYGKCFSSRTIINSRWTEQCYTIYQIFQKPTSSWPHPKALIYIRSLNFFFFFLPKATNLQSHVVTLYETWTSLATKPGRRPESPSQSDAVRITASQPRIAPWRRFLSRAWRARRKNGTGGPEPTDYRCTKKRTFSVYRERERKREKGKGGVSVQGVLFDSSRFFGTFSVRGHRCGSREMGCVRSGVASCGCANYLFTAGLGQ